MSILLFKHAHRSRVSAALLSTSTLVETILISKLILQLASLQLSRALSLSSLIVVHPHSKQLQVIHLQAQMLRLQSWNGMTTRLATQNWLWHLRIIIQRGLMRPQLPPILMTRHYILEALLVLENKFLQLQLQQHQKRTGLFGATQSTTSSLPSVLKSQPITLC